MVALLAALASVSAWGAPVKLRGVDGRGHAFDLAALRGNVVALTFVSRYTRGDAVRVHKALAARDDVKVVSVVDFVGIPWLARGYARRKVAQADGRVLHLCDERGELRSAFGARPDRQVEIFVIDRDGELRGHFDGGRLGEAMRRVDEVSGAQARN